MSEHWVKHSLIYHIYVRSFMDSNHDGVGDLQGVISKLDYLAGGTDQSLGINAIWLSPIYPSPMKDFGYDVSNYTDIDLLFGTLQDFDELMAKAHAKNIKVIMDYIPNHTSSLHPWFVDASSSKDSAKRDWYIWRDPKPDGSAPNNWLSVFGGSAWEFDLRTQQYYLHSFDKDQPDLNWRNPEVVTAMKNALRFWLDKGVDGFRVDAYDFLFKHTDFLDEPPNPEYQPGIQGPHDSLTHIYSFSQPETLVMLKEIAEVLDEYQQKFMVTEVYVKQEKLVEMYGNVGKEWFAPFNFGLITLPWSANVHQTYIDSFDQKVGQLYLPTYVLGNHDKPRIASRVGLAQARNAAILLLTLRGIPFIYYGDELGMVDGVIPPDRVQDPFEKKSPGLKLGRDPQRTPMQWSADLGAGFSVGESWLPIAENYRTFNLKTETEDPQSMLALYKKLIKLRQTLPVLTKGNYISLPPQNEQVFIYTRNLDKDTILVMLNYSPTVQKIHLDLRGGTVLVDSVNMLNDKHLSDLKDLELQANQGLIMQLDSV